MTVPEPKVIDGHPEIILPGDPYLEEQRLRTLRHPIRGKTALVLRDEPREIRITVCAECERVRTILFLSNDRWLCTGCRNAGTATPIPVRLRSPGTK